MIGERDKEVHGSSARSGAAGNGAAGGGWKGSQRMKWSEQNGCNVTCGVLVKLGRLSRKDWVVIGKSLSSLNIPSMIIIFPMNSQSSPIHFSSYHLPLCHWSMSYQLTLADH